MDKRTPERTCIGCGCKKHKDELVRIVLVKDEGEGSHTGIALDTEGRMKGRGAYLCRDIDCYERAVRKKALNRAFKQAVSREALEELKAGLMKEVK